MSTVGWASAGAGADSASVAGQLLSPGQAVELPQPGLSLTVPVDGRLRGPDYTAVVTGVAWPSAAGASPDRYAAATGDRLVVFSLQVSQPPGDMAPLASPAAVATAVLETAGTNAIVDLSTIDGEIQKTPYGSATGTGSDTFVAAVPARSHTADLAISDNGSTQTFSLWTLQRVAPYPAILYRDPVNASVAANPSSGVTVPITNPADGFASPASVSVTSAELTDVPPTGLDPPTNPDRADLVVTFRDRFADPSYPDPNWGHFLANLTPLPGSALSFTTPGSPPVTATAIGAVAPAAQSPSDDGLLDATYVFVVPASTTTGTLAIASTTTTGAEFQDALADPSVTLAVGGPTTIPLTFPTPDVQPSQPTPAWFHRPLPVTGARALLASGPGSSGGAGSGGGLPVWLAALILVVVVGAIVARQVHRRRAHPPGTDDVDIEPDRGPSKGGPASRPDGDRAQPVAPPAPEEQTAGLADVRPDAAGVAVATAITIVPTMLELDGHLVVSVLGPVHISGWDDARERQITKELCCYLALHGERPVTSDQLLGALWPVESDRPEATRKTLHNYLSRLRQAVGPEHLPDAATTGGYRLLATTTDVERFRHLVAEADTSEGEAADNLRARALSLVRGEPFAGVPAAHYGWAFAESWATDLAVEVVGCARRLAADLLDHGDLVGATAAARAGLLASPREELLWEDLARVTLAGTDREATRRLWRDLRIALGSEATGRIRAQFGA